MSVKRENYERKAQLHKSGVGKITAKQENHKEGEKKKQREQSQSVVESQIIFY